MTETRRVIIDPIDTNNALHNAILKRDQVAAFKLINNYKATDINLQSGENTPLMLALKTGNIPIAKAILTHPNVGVHFRDSRGLTALHWACMLRQDDVIEMLLAKGADPAYITPPWAEPIYGPPKHYRNMSPINLYLENVSNDGSTIEIDQVVDSRSFRFHHYTAYSDTAFHMYDLCINLNWKAKDTYLIDWSSTEKKPGENNSSVVFSKNFNAGKRDFFRNRNSIPINKSLHEKMTKISVYPQKEVILFLEKQKMFITDDPSVGSKPGFITFRIDEDNELTQYLGLKLEKTIKINQCYITISTDHLNDFLSTLNDYLKNYNKEISDKVTHLLEDEVHQLTEKSIDEHDDSIREKLVKKIQSIAEFKMHLENSQKESKLLNTEFFEKEIQKLRNHLPIQNDFFKRDESMEKLIRALENLRYDLAKQSAPFYKEIKSTQEVKPKS